MVIRTDVIECPNCIEWQLAEVEQLDGAPFPSFVHTCQNCKMIVTESEWQPLDVQLMLRRIEQLEESERKLLLELWV